MGPWQILYVASGTGAIIALTAYLITDALEMQRTYTLGRDQVRRAITPWPARWFAVAAVLVVLFITAAIAR